MSAVSDKSDLENLGKCSSLIQCDAQQQARATDAPSAGKSANNVNLKKKKTRRKRKQNKPYSKTYWNQRKNSNEKERNRAKSDRAKIVAMGHTLVPCNTNQFLMEEHMPQVHEGFQRPRVPSARTRDSSFSVDSEENYFMSLPEDEEDFLTKEFSSVYEDAQFEHLIAMSKNELIQEYLSMETRLDQMSRRWQSVQATTANVSTPSDSDVDESTKQILKEQNDRIHELQAENVELRRQCDFLAKNRRAVSSSTSTDSESDSSASSSLSSDSEIDDLNSPMEFKILKDDSDVFNTKPTPVAASCQPGDILNTANVDEQNNKG